MIENGYGRLVFIGARPALNPDAGKSLLAYALGKSLLFKLAEMMNEEAKGKNVTARLLFRAQSTQLQTGKPCRM